MPSAEDEVRYERLRSFIIDAETPERGGRHLLGLETAAMKVSPPKDEHEARLRENAAAEYQCITRPSSLATAEQLEFCRRARCEMERQRALRGAGWKTPYEEGYEAFDPKARPVDWDGESNPYPSDTTDHDEWDDGYGKAVFSADLTDAIRPRDDEFAAEEERCARESSLDAYYAQTEELADSEGDRFLAIAAINCQMSLLGWQFYTLELELREYLPADVRRRLADIAMALVHEGCNREVERLGTKDGRLEDFRQWLVDLKVLGVEIAGRNIGTPYGCIGDDLYQFGKLFHYKRWNEHRQAKRLAGQERSAGQKKP